MRSSAYIQMEREREAGLIPAARTIRLDLTPSQLCTICLCVATAAKGLEAAAKREWLPVRRSVTLAGMANLVDLLRYLRGE